MVRTRFAPSPTGSPESVHLGFVIRALWNYAYAKKNQGKFILRIEDTDIKRSRKDTEQAIYSLLNEFGIRWDEGPDVGGPYGPYRQSERLEKYKAAAKELVEKDFAYYDFDAVIREKEEIKQAYESKEKLEELKQRPKARFLDKAESIKRAEAGESCVVRVKIPENRMFEYHDWILKKRISVLGKDIQDLILLKSDGYPTYHLAVVVDDISMKISHVFRGQEWISTTPIHLYLYEAFNHPVPELGHFTVILDKDTGKKFSKRDMTAKFGVKHWLDRGYLHEAILNYLMLLGWAPKDNKEIFSLEEFVQSFDQDGVQKSNPVFNEEKLIWFNGHYIRQKSDEELFRLIKPFIKFEAKDDTLSKVIPLIKDRIITLLDVNTLAGFIFTKPEPVSGLNKEHLQTAIDQLSKVDWRKETIENALQTEVKNKNWKNADFFMTLRLGVAGQKITPPMTECMLILGREEVLARLTAAHHVAT